VNASGSTVVTGANGFVGRHLVAVLHAQAPSPVIEWQRLPSGAGAAAHVRQVDMLNREAVRRAIADDRPARVFHLAGAPHVGNAWRDALPTLQVNVLGTHHLLEAIRQEHPASRVLIVTSAMIYRPGPDALTEDAPLVPSSPYGLSKLAQDQLARLAATQDGLDVVVARPFNHIGPGQDPSFAVASFSRQIALIEAGHVPASLRVGNLEARRDLTDVRDVVAAYLQLMASRSHAPAGSAFNVCSGRAYRIGDLLDALLRLATVPIAVAADPERMRPSDVPLLLGSHDRLTRMSGWLPRVAINDTLADTLAWWRSEVAAGRAQR
jgi:GDP-4-dehydro-6-deoxy-D-mannose reductase